MNKLIQVFLLVITVSLASAVRLSVMGWLAFIGIGSLIIMSFAHFYIHFYAMNSLAARLNSNIIKILTSHLCFLNLFFFQTDADDSKSYLVFDYFFGKEHTALGDFSSLILLLSLLIYIVVSILIVRTAKKEKLTAVNHGLLITSVIITFLMPFFLIPIFSSHREEQATRKKEVTGVYSDIKRALNEKDKVKVLEINSYEISYSDFPKEILELTNLQELHLKGQKINSIPDDIGKLKNLEVLDITDNNLDQINTSICNCSKLKDLRVGGSIDSLPFCLTQMDSLASLTVQSNSVNELMDELRKFKQLKKAHFYTYGILFDREKWWKLTKELGLE